MNLRDHNDWDRINGLLSVSLEPHLAAQDSSLWVLLNGNTGNFCLDYTDEEFNENLAMQRAWSSDTGYYIKILPDNNVRVVSWWNGRCENLSSENIIKNPKKFYKLITTEDQRIGTIISFAKEAFLKLRNSIIIADNGQVSLRAFMYLLAALEGNVDKASDVDASEWHLNPLDNALISDSDWEILYNGFKKGITQNGKSIMPLVQLVLRHASNRLFQEAHREATKKTFQLHMFGGAERKYDSGISDGAYYTPTPLVRTIVQEALWALNKANPLANRQTLRILDPACGSAEFLREALRQLKMLNYDGNVSISGWDISEIACEMARFVLHYENRTEWENTVQIDISQRNSIEYNWAGEPPYDLILMNPPFTSFEHLGSHKDIVREKLKGFFKGQPDAGAVFWKNASELLRHEGVLGLILPNSFLNAETYENLRAHLKEIGMEFSLIGRLGSAGLFEKAMIIPAILVGVKKTPAISSTALWTDHQQSSVYEALRELRIYRLNQISVPTVTPSYSIYEKQSLTDSKTNWSVGSYKIHQLAESLKNFSTVGKLFNIKQGVITGNNAAFLLKKEELLVYPKKEQQYFRPIVMRASIQNGLLYDPYYCFYPYGKHSIETEEELSIKLKTFYANKLLPLKNKLVKRRGRQEKWWELNEARHPLLSSKLPRLISAYFGKSGYFAFDEIGIFLVGQSFAWLPKKDDMKTNEFYFAYLALLHAPIIDSLLEMVSINIAGGQFDLSKHYIENMPLPDLSNADSPTFNYLVDIGRAINKGMSFNKDELNSIVANTYGLNLEILK